MTTLKIILIVLPIVEILAFIIILIRKDKKHKRENKDNISGHLDDDDIPARYVDIQRSEQPFVEYY